MFQYDLHARFVHWPLICVACSNEFISVSITMHISALEACTSLPKWRIP